MGPVSWAESKTIGVVSEVTLLTPIKPGLIKGERQSYEQRLQRELDSLQRRVDQHIPTPVGAMPTIHYARWVILRPARYLQYSNEAPPSNRWSNSEEGHGHRKRAPAKSDQPARVEPAMDREYRSWLLFTSNFDGDMKAYLRDFAVFLGDDVDRIWGNCEHWPPGGCRDFEAYWDYAKRHQIPTNAFYAAYPELTVPRIRQLERFKRAFDEFVAATRRQDGRSIEEIAGRFDEFLTENAEYPNDFPRSGGTYLGLN